MANASAPLSEDELAEFLMQVGHALNLIAELPDWLEHAALPKPLGHAAAESFVMNCRMLTEFFWDTKAGDIGMCSYPTDGRLTTKRPRDTTMLAAKQVAHPTRKRIDEPLATMTYTERCSVREQLLDAGEQFAQLLTIDEQHTRMTNYVIHARSLTEREFNIRFVDPE